VSAAQRKARAAVVVRFAADRFLFCVVVAAAAELAKATTQSAVLIVEVTTQRRLRGAVVDHDESPRTWKAKFCEARTCLGCGRRVSALRFAPLEAPCRECVDDNRRAAAAQQERRQLAWEQL
jgi:hypothetical protein